MKPFTKYVLRYLTGWIALVLLLTFVFSEVGFTRFILQYWWWLILVSLSYFGYCRSIGEEEKKYLYMRQALIYGNFYLLAHLFFRPFLNIEPALFLLLGFVVVGMFVIQKTDLRVKQPFYRIG